MSNEEEKQEASKTNDKEFNFRQQAAAYEKKLEQERQARLEAEKKAEEALRMAQSKPIQDDDDDDEPYVDKRRLKKYLETYDQQLKQASKKEVEQTVKQALSEERNARWMETHNDFHEVMQHANKLAESDPELAETILQMPDTFERQKLVYKNIKALKLHQPKEEKPSIQDTINQNRRGPYYRPTGVSNAPYSNGGDFSPEGQKAAYQKLQDLKNRLRLG